MTLLPAHSVEHGGHDEQARQSGAVQPRCDAFPFVIRHEVQQRTAQDTGNNPKLIKNKNYKYTFFFFKSAGNKVIL